VRTADQGGLWFEKAFTITVSDVNEAPTELALSNNTIAENQPAGTVIGTLSTTDPDVGDTFTYTLVSGTGSTDNASFDIVGDQVTTATVFDYEAKRAEEIAESWKANNEDRGSEDRQVKTAAVKTAAG
jgi:hypothetical protein